MSKLILVRHAAPALDNCVAPNQWPLSEAGRQSCAALARLLAPYLPVTLVASREAKAAETAALLGRDLGVRYTTASGLQEQARSSLGWLSEAEFQTGIASLFAHPAAAVFGDESANQALARFRAALTTVLDQHPDGNVLVVTHGIVMTLLAAQCQPGLDALAFWKQLGLPAAVVFSRPELAVEQVIEQVEADGH